MNPRNTGVDASLYTFSKGYAWNGALMITSYVKKTCLDLSRDLRNVSEGLTYLY